MTAHAQRQPAPAPALKAAATPTEARMVSAALLDAMTALLTLIERETELVRVGKVREAMTTELQKAELARHYAAAITRFKLSQPYMAAAAPDLLATLHRHHDIFRGMLQINLTVLATAHAVSEGIVRGVNAEMQRRNAPQTYNAYGQRSVPGPRNITPIAISRSL